MATILILIAKLKNLDSLSLATSEVAVKFTQIKFYITQLARVFVSLLLQINCNTQDTYLWVISSHLVCWALHKSVVL